MARQAKDGSFPQAVARKGAVVVYPQAAPTRNTDTFRWSDVDGKLLSRAVDCITARGHAVSYALNRAGTCGCITVLAGSERPKYYCETVGDAEATLLMLAELDFT